MTMMKRILALLLVLTMVIGYAPISVGAEGAELCPACGAENCTEVHEGYCFTCESEVCEDSHPVCEDCGRTGCKEEHAAEAPAPLNLEETPDETPNLLTEGEEPKACPTCGVTGCTSAHENWCDTCKADDCGKEHKLCEVCEAEDCGLTHVYCEVCEKYDCGVDHAAPTGDEAPDQGDTTGDEPKTCPTCGQADCQSEHLTWCAECGKDDCGIDHTASGEDETPADGEAEACETCGVTGCESDHANWCEICKADDCGKEHKTCETCGTVDCTSTHENWCDECGKDDCGKTHAYCDFCQKEDCGQTHCPDCGGIDGGHTILCDQYEKQFCDKCGALEENGTLTHKEGCAALCTCTPVDGVHQEGCKLYVEPEVEEEAVPVYDQLLAAETLQAMHDTMMLPENKDGVYALTYDELTALLAHADALLAAIEEPTDDDKDYYDLITETFTVMLICPDCQGEMGEHEEGCARGQAEMMPVDLGNDYIYFDLYYGDVTLTNGTYSGMLGTGVAGKCETVSGTHNANNKYYIFQSNGEAYDKIPEYERLMNGGWGEYITNNTDVVGVINAWNTAAAAVGRKETPAEMKVNVNVVKGNPNVTVMQHHRIIIESAEAATTSFDVTIDNIWSGFQNDDCRDENGNFYADANINDGPHYRTSGGLTFRPQNKTTTATIRLKGDNRFGNVHYEVGGGAGGSTTSDEIDSRIRQMFFCNADDSSNPGTLTVGNLRGDTGENHFDSVIGGANNPNYVPGLVFQGGVIYAGATVLDNCTAIGGGGCGFGGVTIEGGTITAVTATNGAAIGGGIGDGSNGGAADVLISGGTVYAYNKGLAIEGTRESRGEAGTTGGETVYVVMPAVAIGSGSSRRQWTVPAKIEITGGTVYAQSVGGTAIGAGSSNNFDAADANITISGNAVVTAKSVGGTVTAIHEYDQGAFPTYVGKTEKVSASNAIGGGTAGIPFRYETSSLLYAQGNGGDCVLTIEGNPTIYAGSIGGGGVSDLKNSTDNAPRPNTVGKIGSAQVTISGGTTQGQVIMAKGAEMDCYFKMTGGTIDNITKDDSFVFLKENGGAVYVENGNATMSGGTIRNCDDAVDGGVFYVIGGNVEISGNSVIETNTAKNGGVAYIHDGHFTMKGGTIQNNTASMDGGAVYIDDGYFTMISGELLNNEASTYGGGAYVHGGEITIGVENCNGEGEKHDGMYTELKHPVVSGNDASFGGGLAADGGEINIYCGQIVGNTADNAGMGDNVFMHDQNTGDLEKPVLNHIKGQVGEDDNHGMVVIGGEMNIPYKEGQLKIKINYHDNGEDLSFDLWVGHAPDEYYLNLPYCPQFWETTQNGKGLTFVGWTYDTKAIEPPVQEDVDLSFIRDKEDYKALGDPVKILKKHDWKYDEIEKMFYIDFYAVWAPLENNVTYDIDLNNYGSVPDELGKEMTDSQKVGNTETYAFSQTQPSTIQMTNPVIPGYTFKGWEITPSPDKISNWSVVSNAGIENEPVIYYVDGAASGTAALAGYSYKYEDGKFILTTDRNFGDIKFTALLEEDPADYTFTLIGPEGADIFGSLTADLATKQADGSYKITVGQANGIPGISTVDAEYGFKVKGWFTDAAGTSPVTPENWVSNTEANGAVDISVLTPDKVNGIYVGGDFYAIIEYHLADLIIKKNATGSYSGEQTFVFDIYEGSNLLTSVFMKAGGSATVKDLTVGTTYTVKERENWSWRFDDGEKSWKMKPEVEGEENENILTFVNTQDKHQWLTHDVSILNERR